MWIESSHRSPESRGRRARWFTSIALAGLLAIASSACGSEAADEQEAGGAVEGVSRDEMVGQAAPMSLEEAESLGIVDTTISIGEPVGPDSMVTPVTRPADSVRAP